MLRALDCLGIHDRRDVIDALLECRDLLEAVGAANAPLVEPENPDAPSVVFENPAIELVVPGQLDV